jgi:hypothetical protein
VASKAQSISEVSNGVVAGVPAGCIELGAGDDLICVKIRGGRLNAECSCAVPVPAKY